jgi:hypothetical protein
LVQDLFPLTHYTRRKKKNFFKNELGEITSTLQFENVMIVERTIPISLDYIQSSLGLNFVIAVDLE